MSPSGLFLFCYFLIWNTPHQNLFGLAPGESAFVIHAHPDDEAVLTGSAISHLALSGVTVHGVVGSDGEASTKSPNFSRNGHRVGELLTSYGILGDVPESRIHRLSLPDGELPLFRRIAAERIAVLITRYAPRAIITAGPLGFGHPDHSATHEAAVLAVSMVGQSSDNSKSTIWALQENGSGKVKIPSNYDQKIIAVLAHHSQFPGIVLPNGVMEISDFAMQELKPYETLLREAETYSMIQSFSADEYAGHSSR